MNRHTEKMCACCDTAKPFDQFYKDVIPNRNRYVPYCKSCCRAKMKQYKEIIGNEQAALWCLLAELGIPFLKDVWNEASRIIEENESKTRKPDIFLTYIRCYNEMGIVAYGFWESDVMLTDFYNVKVEDDDTIEVKSSTIDLNKEYETWGDFRVDGMLDESAYKFLNKTYDEYTKDLGELDLNVQNRYRDLAKAEWRLRKANENGDISEIKSAQDILNKQLALLNLNDFKTNDTDERRLFIDRIAWMIEETEPAEEEDQSKYTDIAGYEKIYNSWMRSMQNILTGDRKYPDIPKDVL